MILIVVAFAQNRGIGHCGQLPWRLPSDLRRFRDLTMGQTVLMGRKTFESLPDAYRPLPGRRNLIVSARSRFRPTGAEVYASVEDALEACDGDCYVVGGGSIYEQALPLADRVYATLVQASPVSDTFFPELPDDRWHPSERTKDFQENGIAFRFATYERIA